MDAEYQRELIRALVEGHPVYVQEHNGDETVVYRLEMRGDEAIGFRATEGDRLITIAEVRSVSLTSTRNADAPFETLLSLAVDSPTIEGEKAQVFKGGVLTIIPSPLPFGASVPDGAFVEIGFATLPATVVAPDGYELVYYRLADEHARLLPFPFYVYAADGTYYWHIFIESVEDLRDFRDANTPGCAVEGLPAATSADEIIEAQGEH